MWTNNHITQLLHIKLPIIQAPMAGGATTPELVANVANAGALGSLGAGYMAPDAIRTSIKKIRTMSMSNFAVGLFVPNKHSATDRQIQEMQKIITQITPELNLSLDKISPPYTPSFDEQVEVILDENIPIVSFTFGIPSSNHLAELKKRKIVLIGTATNLLEAEFLKDQGFDIIVAQSIEAGGHRGTFATSFEDGLITLDTLIKQLIAAKLNLPIVASGGIMDADKIVNTLKLGAQAVQMGTIFLTTTESGIHPKYKETLLNLTSDETILSKCFSGKLVRGIKNTFINRMEQYSDRILDYPIQNTITQAMRKQAAALNNPEFLSLYAGTEAYKCAAIGANQLILQLNQNVQALLSKG